MFTLALTAPAFNLTIQPIELKELESRLNETDTMELDFVNLPNYGIVDEINSVQNDSFSCYERHYGYYADIFKNCSTFHLCYPIQDPSSQHIFYQRFSFFCSDNAVFDQKNLVCVENESESIDCQSSINYYDISNEKLIESLKQSQPEMFADEEKEAQYNSTSLENQKARSFLFL